MSRMRRILPLFAVLLLLAALVGGCAAKQPAPVVQTAPAAAPAPAPVDSAALLKTAAVRYFNTLPPSNHIIDTPDLKKLVASRDPNVFLVDIRRTEDFAKAHVDGFTNIPFATIGANIDQLPKDKQIVITCYTGQTAGQTIGVLRMAGYNAMSVKGGYANIEKSDVPQVKA